MPVVLLGAFFAHPDDKMPASPMKDWKGATAFKVLRTIDGDTIEIEQDGKPVKVRLIGVGTPETVHPSKPGKALGKEVFKFTSNLLKGESVYLEFDKDKTDKYGRMRALAYRAPDGLFVNAEIIRQDYGHAYTKYTFNDELMKQFRAHEQTARKPAAGCGAARKRLTAKTPRRRSRRRMTVRREIYT